MLIFIDIDFLSNSLEIVGRYFYIICIFWRLTLSRICEKTALNFSIITILFTKVDFRPFQNKNSKEL